MWRPFFKSQSPSETINLSYARHHTSIFWFFLSCFCSFLRKSLLFLPEGFLLLRTLAVPISLEGGAHRIFKATVFGKQRLVEKSLQDSMGNETEENEKKQECLIFIINAHAVVHEWNNQTEPHKAVACIAGCWLHRQPGWSLLYKHHPDILANVNTFLSIAVC